MPRIRAVNRKTATDQFIGQTLDALSRLRQLSGDIRYGCDPADDDAHDLPTCGGQSEGRAQPVAGIRQAAGGLQDVPDETAQLLALRRAHDNPPKLSRAY